MAQDPTDPYNYLKRTGFEADVVMGMHLGTVTRLSVG